MTTTYEERSKNYKITTVQFHREEDAAIIDWLDGKKSKSEAIRQVINEHLSGQAAPAAVDPDAVKTVIESALGDYLGEMRRVIQASIDTALDGLDIEGAQPHHKESNGDEGLLSALAVSLDIDN